MCSRRHSTQARTSDRTGAPVNGPGDQPTPENLSVPDAANARQSSSWCSARTFTANIPADSICGQLVDVLPGQASTSGGSIDNAANAWHVNPLGPPSPLAVMIVTPVQ